MANLCVFRVISSVDLNHGCALVSHAPASLKKGRGISLSPHSDWMRVVRFLVV